MRVAERHSGVAIAAVPREKHGKRLSHNVGTADNHGLLSIRRQIVALQELDDACRSAGDEAREVLNEPPYTDRVKSVNILFGINGEKAGIRVEALRKGKLEQNAIDVPVSVESADEGQELFLRRRSGQAVRHGVDADLPAGLFLVAHVHLGGRVLADQNDSQAGGPHTLRSSFRNFGAQFRADVLGRFLSINENHVTHLLPCKNVTAFRGAAPREVRKNRTRACLIPEKRRTGPCHRLSFLQDSRSRPGWGRSTRNCRQALPRCGGAGCTCSSFRSGTGNRS